MLIVADSSPLQALIRIEHVGVLPRLFSAVFVPPQVVGEMSQPETPETVRSFMASPPDWLVIREPTGIQPIAGIQAGEEAAIALALELRAGALLIDDRNGRRAAAVRQLTVIGTIGVLERAADAGMIELASAFDRLRETDFRIAARLLDERLKEHLKRMGTDRGRQA